MAIRSERTDDDPGAELGSAFADSLPSTLESAVEPRRTGSGSQASPESPPRERRSDVRQLAPRSSVPAAVVDQRLVAVSASLERLQELGTAPESLRSRRFDSVSADIPPGSLRAAPSSAHTSAPSSAGGLLRGTHLDESVESFDIGEAIDYAARRELPAAVMRVSVRRLGQAALMHVALLVAVIVVGALAVDHGSPLWLEHYPGYLPPLLAAIGLNVALFVATRLRSIEPPTVLKAGFAYLVLYCLALSLFRHHHAWPNEDLLRSWSPAAVVIVLFGAMVPLRPSSVLVWGLIAAAMDPLAARLTGSSMSFGATTLLALSPLTAAGLAYFSSSVTHDLTEQIAREQEVGSYRLLELLGAGAMGDVWRAEHRMLARGAAIKLIKPKALVSDDPAEARRIVQLFELEVQATTMLTSPHTIHIYDFGITRAGHFYYAMELLDGFDLQTLVEQHGPQPPARVAHILAQVADSLGEAHGHQYVHRDLKPANVMACRYGGHVDFVKVLDFGLVLDASSDPDPAEDETEPGKKAVRLVGTPAIMAPEMLVAGARVDHRSDIYALGCLGYWLLTGCRLFDAESKIEMLRKHATATPVAPSRRVGGEIPGELEQLVMQCVEKNPSLRPRSAYEVQQRLEESGLARIWAREGAQDFWERHACGPMSARLTPAR